LIDSNVRLGYNVKIPHPAMVNLFNCTIGDHSQISPFVEIGGGCIIGRYCRIRPNVTLGGYLTLEDYVFLGNGVQHCNDVYPMAYENEPNPTFRQTVIRRHTSIGVNSTIMPGVEIGPYALVGAGTVITKDVPAYSIVIGNPMYILHQFENEEQFYKHLGGAAK
jgi:UDP-2-acetamido-3-amino-2,3-dideoxy-glucuronate N-acetyltransferase